MNKKFSIAAFLLLLAFGALGATAQTSVSAAQWMRVESENRAFSIALPPGAQIFSDKQGFAWTTAEGLKKGKFNNLPITDIRYLTASTGDASFYVIRYKTSNLKDGFRVLSDAKAQNKQVYTASINNFAVKIVTVTTEKFFRQQMFVGFQDEIYEIFGGARTEQNEALKYVFASVKFNGEKAFSAPSALDGKVSEQTVSLAALTDTPFALEREKRENPPANPKPDVSPGAAPLLLLIKPSPEYTPQARKAGTKGVVRLRVTFAADGSIEKISVIDDLANGLTEQAVKAARRIRFLPEEKDGSPVTTTKTLEYNFQIY